jgi:hypothetical protein
MKKIQRADTAQIIQNIKADTLAEMGARDLFERYAFRLPNHIRLSRGSELRKTFEPVIGDIYRWPETKFQPSPAKPLDVDESAKRAILAFCSSPHEANVVTASADAEKALGTLAQLARDGNGKALWQFAEIVKNAVIGLNQIATSNPDAIRPFSRQSDRWPMLRSTAPLLCDDDALLNTIQLGKTAGVQLDKYSKWKPDYAAVVAAELIKHIQFIRLENPIGLDGGKEVEFSKFLPPFSKKSAPHWWFIAQKFLLATYPKPQEISELDKIVTAKSKQKSPGRRRTAILEKIHARFIHLAYQT